MKFSSLSEKNQIEAKMRTKVAIIEDVDLFMEHLIMLFDLAEQNLDGSVDPEDWPEAYAATKFFAKMTYPNIT